MALPAGIVCGKCDRLNTTDRSTCTECGNDLALFRKTRPPFRQAAQPIVDPLEKRQRPVSQPPVAARKGAEEKPMEQARHYVCISCFSPVPSGHKFCGKCGTPLDSAHLPKDPQFFGDMQAPGKAKLILIKGEGMDGISYHLNSEEHIAGRSEGAILFTEDKWLSPRHANFLYRNDKLVVRDENSVNGIYVCIREPVTIKSGTTFMAGEQVFRVEDVPAFDDTPTADGTYFFSSPRRDAAIRVVQVLEGGGDGMVVHSHDNQVIIGREGGDMNFPNDPYISATHAKAEYRGGKLTLMDLGSKNGTYMKIDGEYELSHGDYIFLGRQLLRVEITN
jgi:pSer/pThr/pTyr-binding forkhead associated (FHA) protein